MVDRCKPSTRFSNSALARLRASSASPLPFLSLFSSSSASSTLAARWEDSACSALARFWLPTSASASFSC